MSNRRAWLGTIVVVSALVLAACSKSSTPGATSTGGAPVSVPASVPGSVAQAVNPGSDFCTELKTENAKAAALGKTFGSALASKDFATTKQTLAAYFGAVSQSLAQVEASMSSAPANVQAALGVVNQFFGKVQSAVASANSMKELETSMTNVSNTAQLKVAGATLSAYSKSQCGDLSSPTP
jgi:hypothetical protein